MKVTGSTLKKLLSISLAAVTLTAAAELPALSAAAYAENTDDSVSADEYLLADSIQNGTILHCFCWAYEDITDYLQEIAAAGFTSIQVSPVQRNGLWHDTWYNVYNPSGINFGSVVITSLA